VAYNYKRDESEPEFYSAEEISALISEKGLDQFKLIDDTGQDFQEMLRNLNNGKQLWPYFLILALLFVFAETLIIRFWR